MTALRFALRELRGGLRGFFIFIACIALGVMAISGVGAVSNSLSEGLAREGRVILGGDLTFNFSHREAQPDEAAFLRGKGQVSAAATMRAMARGGDEQAALVEIKAVDTAYPLAGMVALEPAAPLAEVLAQRGGVYGAAADPALLDKLGVKVPARVIVGAAQIEIRAALTAEPDKLAGGIGFGPRLLVNDDALRATGLLQPGSLVRWHYRVALAPGADDAAVTKEARERFPDAGWEIRSRSNASPQLERNIERFTQYLTIVGLTALLVGGVGVGNAVRAHLERKRDTIATMKALGAPSGRLYGIYLTQVMILALVGSVIGALLGAAMPFLADRFFGTLLPLPLAPDVDATDLFFAVVYGLAVAVAFALWPLGRIHDIPVAALFRDTVSPEKPRPRPSIVVATVLAVLALATLAVALAYDRKVAMFFILGAAGVFLVLRGVGALVMALAARIPRPRSPLVRMAVANIHRPGAPTPSVVLSLGLALALVVTLVQIDSNLTRQFTASLPERAPSFFFVDIPPDDAPRFAQFVRERAPNSDYAEVPLLRGRIVSVNGVSAEEVKAKPDAAWALQGDRGVTYSADVPEGSRIVAGQWWKPDYDGPPLVSLEQRIADGIGVKLGETITVNVLGRNITATVANLRELDWQNLGINFVLVYSPNAFRGAPHTRMATLTTHTTGTDNTLIPAIATAFPSVTSVKVKDAIDAIATIVTNLTIAIRSASTVTLIASALVLGGAMAAAHGMRVFDTVMMRVMGATMMRMVMAYVVEFVVVAVATAAVAMVAGTLAGWAIVTLLMRMSFAVSVVPVLVAVAVTVAAAVVLALATTVTALRQKPAAVLRHL